MPAKIDLPGSTKTVPASPYPKYKQNKEVQHKKTSIYSFSALRKAE